MTDRTKNKRLLKGPRKSIVANEPIIMVVGGPSVLLAIDQKGKTHRIDSRLLR